MTAGGGCDIAETGNESAPDEVGKGAGARHCVERVCEISTESDVTDDEGRHWESSITRRSESGDD